MPWSNGQIPDSVVSVVLASGHDENGYWEFRCTPAFAARWAFAKLEAERRFGRTIHIRTGWNIYRPLFPQQTARRSACAQGNCNGAAYPGSSSHGGEWNGRPCLAVDVDPNGLTWDQVDQAMAAAGFAIQQITEAMSGIRGGERWHYIDFNAFGPVPAGSNSTSWEDIMAKLDNEDRAWLDAWFGIIRSLLQVPGLPYGYPQATLNAVQAIDPLVKDVQSRVRGGDPRGDMMQLIREDLGKPITADVDEAALAKEIAPLLPAHVDGIGDSDLARIGKAVADEQAKRLAN